MFSAMFRALSSRIMRRRPSLWYLCRRAESNLRDFRTFRVSPPNLAKTDRDYRFVKTYVAFDPRYLPSSSLPLLSIPFGLLPNRRNR
jgi:hypothetical protein